MPTNFNPSTTTSTVRSVGEFQLLHNGAVLPNGSNKPVFKKSSPNALTHGFLAWTQLIELGGATLSFPWDNPPNDPNGFRVESGSIDPYTTRKTFGAITFTAKFPHNQGNATFTISASLCEIIDASTIGGALGNKVLVIKDTSTVSAGQWLGTLTVKVNNDTKTFSIVAGEAC